MPRASQQHYYPNEYAQTNGYHHEATNGHYHNVGNEIAQQNSQSELQHCHQTIANLEGRIVLLEKMCRDYESRLQVQEDARIASDFEKKKAREGYEQRIQHYERRISDMTLHIRTRDTQFLKAQEKNRRLQKDFQTMQLKKHEMIQQAKREEREAMRREIDRERASLDTKQQPSGAIASNSISGSHGHTNGTTAAGVGVGVGMRGDIRRQPSSGSMFTKAFAGQAPVGSGNKGSDLKRTDQLRAACMEGSLNDFFQLPP